MGKIKPKIYFSKDILISQLDKIIRDRGLNQTEFNEKIGVAQAITKWKSGQTPSAESLIAIKKIFGVSIDQLLTGEEPHSILQEFSPESYDSRTPGPLDGALIAEVLEEIREVVKKYKIKLTKEQSGGLVKKIYDECADNKLKPDENMVKNYLCLI
jgi:transcriptional regulator with XRE-family HTH domain